MFIDLAHICQIASKNPDVRVVVFNGAGSAFSAGADPSDLAVIGREASEDLFLKRIEEAQKIFDDVEAIPKPSIAAINGHAVGAGLQLALACDFRIAVRGAKLGLTDVKNGIIPALGATKRLLNSDASPGEVAKAQSRLFKTDDAMEGIAAFLEKRAPHFKGS